MTRTRQPIRGLSKTGFEIAADAAADKARKAASKAALKAAKAAPAPEAPPVEAPPAEATEAPDRAEYLKALRVDFDALTEAGSIPEGQTFEAYVAEQGVDPLTGETVAEKQRYQGPMLALVAARRHYSKAANGILCNGDRLATLCGHYKRPVTVAALIMALKLPGNPYLALNEGQQSMNLRNKARHALKNGMLTLGEVEACLKAAHEA
jgi:hypothetical protein